MSDSTAVVIFGASYQGQLLLYVLREQGTFEVVSFLDDNPTRQGTTIEGVPVAGGMEWLAEHGHQNLGAIVAIGNNDARLAIGSRLQARGVALVNALHPSAIIMQGVTMGYGNFIAAGSILVSGTHLEDNIVVNTGAALDHDCTIHSGAYIAPGVRTAGGVTIGRGAFVGVGTTIGPGVTIGEGCIVGGGSLVLNHLPPRVVAFGAPARVVKRLEGPPNWRKILGGVLEDPA